MRQSTTRWLEVLGHKKLRVKTDFQREVDNGGRLEIVRLSKLYFDRPHHSVILSISSLSPENLSAEEIKQIRQGKIPLGKIFGGNGQNGLRKTAISIKRVKDLRLARKLNVRDPRCFSKEYALWSGERWVGTIKEIFNEESFKRIWR
jgi:chorismate-pyruvate lyase